MREGMKEEEMQDMVAEMDRSWKKKALKMAILTVPRTQIWTNDNKKSSIFPGFSTLLKQIPQRFFTSMGASLSLYGHLVVQWSPLQTRH